MLCVNYISINLEKKLREEQETGSQDLLRGDKKETILLPREWEVGSWDDFGGICACSQRVIQGRGPLLRLLLAQCVQLLRSCPTLCKPMDGSLPGSSVPGIFLARILEWVAISFSRGSSQPRVWTQVSCVSCTANRFFTTEPPGKPVVELQTLLGSWSAIWERQEECREAVDVLLWISNFGVTALGSPK